LGRLLATGAGRFFFTELPTSPIVLVSAVGTKVLTKVPPRSMVSQQPRRYRRRLADAVSGFSLAGSFLPGSS
jgi:hypothetical protein